MYSDTYLDYWGNQFVNRRLHQHGLMFVQFLQAPEFYIGVLGPAPLPLLPAQRQVAERLAAESGEEIAAIERDELRQLERDHRVRGRNGALVEPLHHTAWPRRRPRYLQKEVGDE